MATNKKNKKATGTHLNSKAEKLSNLKDEVRDFHPLLDKLFRKITNITDVEYTHGITEMGADFVLSKKHETFGFPEFIGVIAKVGKIVQDYSDIERQIEECDIPRTFFGGKEKIRVSEIWVMITEHITKHAQDKIHEKYKSRKITFVDGGRLEKLIDNYLPTFWTDVSLEVGEYLSSLRMRNEATDKNMSLLQVENKKFYIEQDVYERYKSDYKEKKRVARNPEKVDIYDVIERKQLILIEGGMGSGKSKLIRQLVDHYTQPNIYLEKNFLPIFITYKEFVEDFSEDIDLLIKNQVSKNLNDEIKATCTYLLMIDGVDEKKLVIEEQIESMKNLFEKTRKLANTKVIITSRYLYGVSDTEDLDNSVSRYELRALSLRRTIEFIRAVCQQLNVKNRLIEDLKKSQLFKDLPKSPIAAILLAKLINDNSQDLPSNMTELYSKYTELVLGRWDMDKGLQSQKEYESLSKILIEIAKYMIDYEHDFISVNEAKQIFESYLKARNLKIGTEELFNKMISRCEIVGIDYKKQVLSFKHRTFAEFFYAKHLHDDKQLLIDKRVFDVYWANTFFFCLGLKKDCPQILDEIMKIKPDSEFGELSKITNMSNYFLAAYTTPYQTIINGLKGVMIEAAQLYTKTVYADIPSTLKQLPHMYVFWFFRMLISDSYSYEFFKDAIEEAALSIDEDSIESRVKAYAIFFLSVAHFDIGENKSLDESFELLLKNYSDLPTDVYLGVRHISKKIKPRTSLVKKQVKRIEKILGGSISAKIKEMYEQPIKK